MTTFASVTPNLLVRDIARSVAFYRDVLGFTVKQTVPDSAPFVFVWMERDGVPVFLNDPKAVPAVDRMIRRKGWRGRRKLRQVKAAGVQTLLGMPSENAKRAVAQAAATGDRVLKKIVRLAVAGGAHGG